MSQQAQPSAFLRQQDASKSLHAFINAVLGGEPTCQIWVVLVRNQATDEEREHHYLASSPDDAETLGHHEATQHDAAGNFFVQALHVMPQRALWDVLLQGRAQLCQALPSGMPLLVGRVVASTEDEARELAMAVFGRGRLGEVGRGEWRFVECGDLFTVIRT